jgi:hypothetical protein
MHIINGLFDGGIAHTRSWASLQFQPHFTATAANLNFGYWSHDLGGHRPGATGTVSYDQELYLRWLQWGVFARQSFWVRLLVDGFCFHLIFEHLL